MTVTAPPAGTTAAAALSLPGAITLFAFLLRPARRKRIRGLSRVNILLVCSASLLALGTLAGCGTGTGFFGQPQQTYNVTVTATATDATGGTLTRNTVIAITVQ